MPIPLATSWTSAPSNSHNREISFMNDTLVARKALEAYLIISADSGVVMTNGVSIRYNGL